MKISEMISIEKTIRDRGGQPSNQMLYYPPEGEGPFEIIPRNGQFLFPPNVVRSVYLLCFGIHEQVVFSTVASNAETNYTNAYRYFTP